MRILIVSPYISLDTYRSLSRTKSGFGYMVFEISKALAKENHVELFQFSAFNNALVVNNVHVLNQKLFHKLWRLRLLDFLHCLRVIIKFHFELRTVAHLLYHFTSIGLFENYVRTNKYDIINFHGISPMLEMLISICRKYNIPFVVTLHGLNSFSDNVELSKSVKKLERDFLYSVRKDRIPLILISSGISRKINDYLGISEAFNQYVVTNGCNTLISSTEKGIRLKYNLSADDFIILYVGNITYNKNQVQLLRAYSILPFEYQKRIKILFIGDYNNKFGQEILDMIIDSKLEKSVFLCGVVDKMDVSSYYVECDATCMTSIAEGFGLSIIEGFSYGLPSITFSDLDAVSDVYSPDAMITLEDRTDIALKDGLIDLVNKNWNKDAIKLHAESFNLEKMCESYISSYKSIISSFEG